MTADWPVGLPTRLRPVEVLAAGTSATVWRARDRRTGRDVAVKVLDPVDLRRTDGAAELRRRRFEREGRALARLRGLDGVVTVHELGLTPDGVGWLVTDLATHGSLGDRGRAGVGAAELVPLAGHFAGTLAEVHRLEIVHGDLSPANLLVDDHGRGRLADFGLSVLVGDDAGPGGLTPAFAAPERLAGGPPTAAGDVHALAASLAWVLDGPAGELGPALDAACHPDPSRRPDARALRELLLGGPSGRRATRRGRRRGR